ncbi:MAG: RHS repeat-associated core domain-containing protein [Pyrinomonadaceae bacterium]
MRKSISTTFDTNSFALTERDEATGLDHATWRKNDAKAGRWTSPDPYKGSMSIIDPQSFNRYSYVGNDPINFVDPSGLYWAIDWGSCQYQFTITTGFDTRNQQTFDVYVCGLRWIGPIGIGGDTDTGGIDIGVNVPTPPSPQPCDAKQTGDTEVDTLTRFLFGESDKGNPAELEAIGQTFLNAHWLNSTEFGCGFLNVVDRISRANDDNSAPYQQAANDASISRLTGNCVGYKVAQAVAKQIVADVKSHSMPATVSDVRKKVSSAGILWFLGGSTLNTPTLQFGETRFFNYFPGSREGDGTFQTAQESASRGRNSCDNR